MTHRPELLSAMLDGEVTEDEAIWVGRHLDECGRCRAELDDLAAARAAIRGLPMLDLPDELHPADNVIVGPWRRRLVVAVASVAAAAAVAVAALGVVGLTDDPTVVDVTTAEEILTATASLDVVSDGSEAAALLEAADQASFQARMTSACVDAQTLVETAVTVTHSGNVTVMSDPLAQLTVLTDGAVSTGTIDGPIRTVSVSGESPRFDGYTVTSEGSDPDRERPTEIYTLARAGVDRARLWIDVESGAVVHRQLLTASGEVACVTELADFEPMPASVQASIPFDIRAQVTETIYETAPADFPPELGGLRFVSSYRVDGGEVAVYGDGVMLVAVMRLDGGAPTLTDSARLPVTMWEADGTSWVVIGAVPDDIRDAVAADLPSAGSSNPVADGWRRLFG